MENPIEKALEKIGGNITVLGARVGRKIDDGNFGNFEKSCWIEVGVPKGMDVGETMDMLDEYLESEITRRIALWKEETPSQVQKPPKSQEKPVLPPQQGNEPSDEIPQDTILMTIKTIKVGFHPDTGEKTFRVQGQGPKNLEYKGNWVKFGVAVYEALDEIGGYEAYWMKQEAGEYPPTDPTLRARVELDGKKPMKVVGFVRLEE